MKSENLKNITHPNDQGYQVRIQRDGKSYSRYFSHREWGGPKKSLEAAINWRDMQKAILPKQRKYFTKISSNRTTGMVGVSKAIHYDKRRDASYLRFQVYYQTLDGLSASKTFQVGRVDDITPDDEFHAFRTAATFRHEYEECMEEGQPFNPERYSDWKNQKLY